MATEQLTLGAMLDEEAIEDGSDDESMTLPANYDVMTFGADMPVDGLVKRLEEGNIYIPEFQRGYVRARSVRLGLSSRCLSVYQRPRSSSGGTRTSASSS